MSDWKHTTFKALEVTAVVLGIAGLGFLLYHAYLQHQSNVANAASQSAANQQNLANDLTALSGGSASSGTSDVSGTPIGITPVNSQAAGTPTSPGISLSQVQAVTPSQVQVPEVPPVSFNIPSPIQAAATATSSLSAAASQNSTIGNSMTNEDSTINSDYMTLFGINASQAEISSWENAMQNNPAYYNPQSLFTDIQQAGLNYASLAADEVNTGYNPNKIGVTPTPAKTPVTPPNTSTIATATPIVTPTPAPSTPSKSPTSGGEVKPSQPSVGSIFDPGTLTRALA